MSRPSDRMRVLLAILVASAGAACSASSSPSAAQDGGSEGAAPLPAGTSPVVTIPDGPLQGHVDGSVYAFLGIPYSAPPVGALRWKEPRAPAPCTSLRDASMLRCRAPPSA